MIPTIENRSDSEIYNIPISGNYNFKNISLNDPRVWNTFKKGNTKGIFQLEKQLGQDWSRKSRPNNIEELAILISILRPGCLEAKFSESYCNRKNGQEEVSYLHPSLEPILNDTFGCLIYQEQAMRISVDIAGFNEIQADNLRKAIGKKKPEEMVKVKKMFLEGTKTKGIVSDKESEEIFGWIEKSVRYSFNKCLSPETTVETKDHIQTLSDTKIGDMIKAPSSDYDKDEFVEVLDIIHNGKKDVLEIELSSGNKIRCTIDHKFLCNDGNIRPLYEIIEKDLEIMCED